MSRRLVRLLAMDERIRARARCVTADFAAQLEVSDRTIRDDLAFLRNRYDAPLEFDLHRGWHYTDPNWRLPSIILSTGELFALTLGARMLKAYTGLAYQSQLEGAIARLAERLPEEIWVDLQQLAEENVLVRVGAELDLDPEIWHQLERACQQKQRVWMRYATPGKPLSEREFDPYLLHFSGHNPYVTGWCHSRAMVRDFRVDRIQAIALKPERFEVSSTFDRIAYFKDVFKHEVGGLAQAVVIWFDAATAPYIQERRWHPAQEIEVHADQSITLKFLARGLMEVKRWVLYYGAGARVLSPPELVELVRGEIEGMVQEYQKELKDACNRGSSG